MKFDNCRSISCIPTNNSSIVIVLRPNIPNVLRYQELSFHFIRRAKCSIEEKFLAFFTFSSIQSPSFVFRPSFFVFSYFVLRISFFVFRHNSTTGTLFQSITASAYAMLTNFMVSTSLFILSKAPFLPILLLK